MDRREWADAIIKELNKNEVDLADLDLSTEWELEPIFPKKKEYPFETRVRPWDGEVVEAITGIPADSFVDCTNTDVLTGGPLK